MGVGYQNHAIYLLNPMPNSRLSTGMHYSLDDGKTWKQSAMRGVTAQPIQIAVHPTDANVVALATEAGLLLSMDHGETFERLGEATPVTAAAFGPDGSQLFFGLKTLSVYDMATQQIEPVATPSIGIQDAIGYIAVNPVDADEAAFATFERNIYLSQGDGQPWQQIPESGTGIASQ
jgi:photosystem II stability/assembly factor-like uncharacterized protein